jgi:pimeloyl-ACP methyl ester carboxylesterase
VANVFGSHVDFGGILMTAHSAPHTNKWIVLIIGLALGAMAAAPAAAAVQTKEQQKCSTGVDKGFSKTLKAVGKEMNSCIKDISKLKATAATCFRNDRKGKILKSMLKTEASHAGNCTGNLPEFGFAGAGHANRLAKIADAALLDALFGDDLQAALPNGGPDAALSKCQQGVAKALTKCHDARAKTYAKCKKKALSGGATDQAAVTTCVTDDGGGKLDKSCDLNSGGKVDKVRGAIAKSCASVDLAAAFPGCATGDAELLHGCLVTAEACAACGSIAEVAGDLLGTDCDAYDNGASDNSCIVLGWENVVLPNGVEPAETPGTDGVVVTNAKLIEQFGGTEFSLNNSIYTRFRAAGPEQTPDAILIFNAGFGGDTNNAKMLIEDFIPKMFADHGLLIEIWGYHRRSNQLEDREGVLIAAAAGDEDMGLDWFYGADMGFTLSPALVAGPNRRAVYYNTTDDIPFLANWTVQMASRDIDAIVEAARAVVSNDNVFMAGHSAGTGFTARYAATDFDLTGGGPAEPGYAKLRGLVLFEGGGGSTLGDPLTADSADRIVAKFDGGLFGAVRDGAPRCVDGTTACTIATEAADCFGQSPPVCTEPATSYTSFFGPELLAAAELAPIQGTTDLNTGLSGLQKEFSGPGTAAVDLVPGLVALGLLPPSTNAASLGQFLDDDEIGASLNPALANSLGKLAPAGTPVQWLDIDDELPSSATPNNGPAPTTLPAGNWGQEKEVVSMDRFYQTFNFADSNAADWYYEGSGYSVTSSPGRCVATVCTVGNVGAGCADNSDCAQSVGLDSSVISSGLGRRDIVNMVEAGNIDIPVIAFGGSNGLTPVGASYLSFAKSIGSCAAPSCTGEVRVVDESLPSEAFPTYGGIDGGYEVYIREGLAHVDVIAGEDIPDVDVIGPLGAFIARNVQ